MLQVESTGSGRNDNEAVGVAASEAFARWLHRRYDPGRRTAIRGGHIVSPRNTSSLRHFGVQCCIRAP